VRRAALVLIALALTGCETSAEKSAKLERAAKLEAKRTAVAARGLTITKPSDKVAVLAASALKSSEGAAVVVTLHNRSNVALHDVPIEITVKGSGGATIYTNDAPGLAAALVSVPLLRAHATTNWIDDQVQATGTPKSVSAKVGEGEAVAGAIPRLVVEGAHLVSDETSGPEAEGSVVNHSAVGQHELVVYALARRAGRAVAAGRAVIPQAEAGSSTRFQVFFIGDPRGAQLEVSAAPTTFG
jgi:hypothetical protein